MYVHCAYMHVYWYKYVMHVIARICMFYLKVGTIMYTYIHVADTVQRKYPKEAGGDIASVLSMVAIILTVCPCTGKTWS